MPNTRKLDRLIADLQRKLEAVQQRKTWALTGAERRAVVRGAATGAAKVARGKSPARADRLVEDAWAGAVARLTAELTAATTARTQIVNEAAAAKTQARGNRWW